MNDQSEKVIVRNAGEGTIFGTLESVSGTRAKVRLASGRLTERDVNKIRRLGGS